MIYVRTPNDEELREFKRMTRQEIGRVAQRAQMILLSAQQHTVPEIARIFAVKAWLAEQSRIQLFYLPTYCSHLNPVENIWLRLKGQMAANRLYGSLQCLLDGVAGFFNAMTPELALTWAAH